MFDKKYEHCLDMINDTFEMFDSYIQFNQTFMKKYQILKEIRQDLLAVMDPDGTKSNSSTNLETIEESNIAKKRLEFFMVSSTSQQQPATQQHINGDTESLNFNLTDQLLAQTGIISSEDFSEFNAEMNMDESAQLNHIPDKEMVNLNDVKHCT